MHSDLVSKNKIPWSYSVVDHIWQIWDDAIVCYVENV